MTDTAVIEIAMNTMMVTAKLAAPILVVSLAIGVFVSLIQSVTQVQEYTLTFVPKLGGIALVILVAGSWMLHEMISFTQDLFASLPNLLGI
jgi:flagellar biosynthesis protein FliQ